MILYQIKIEERIGVSVVSNAAPRIKIQNILKLFLNNKSLKLELNSNFIFPILFR